MGKTLIVCEKPSAAVKIASALAERRPTKRELNGVPYYEFMREGKEMVVVPALGHLFTLKNLRPMRDYPVYEVGWVPTYEVDRRAARTRAFVEAIGELAKGADEFISACDFDIEGSVIAANVFRHLCGEGSLERAKRMKFSTLTTQELRRAYEELMPRLDFELIDTGIARHVLDWYWGMNTSKALSAAAEAAHKRFAKLSAGRVQSPTLKILAEREREIKAFKPEPFWVVSLLLELDGKEVVAEHVTPRFFDKAEAERALEACKDKPARVAAIQTRQYHRPPPVPFDLGLLQSEAYRCFGYTPMRTQQIAQALYQAALISYPRTSSQKLPATINYAEIIEQLGELSKQYKRLVDELLAAPELKPNEGKKCVVGETLVILSDGEILPIKELVEKHNRTELVGLKNDFSTIHSEILDRFLVSGKRELMSITLQTNDEILVTPDHPVLVLEEKPQWIDAGNVRKGMLLAVPERINVKRKSSASNILEILDTFPEKEQRRILLDLGEIREVIKRNVRLRSIAKRLIRETDFKYNTVRSYLQRGKIPYSIIKFLLREGFVHREDLKKHIKGYTWAGAGGNKIIKLPFSLTPEFLYFTGLIMADGHNTGREVQIYNSEGLGNIFRRCCSSLGLKVKNYGSHLSAASKLLCEILDKLCVFKGKKARKLDFPNLILKQPEALVLAFIAGYFDGDGSALITNRTPVIGIGSKSKLFLKKLKLALLTFGISSRLHSNAVRIYSDDTRVFHETVGKFVLVKKRELDSCAKMENIRSSKTVLLSSQNIKQKLNERGLGIRDLTAKIGRIRYTTRSGYNGYYSFTKDKLSEANLILQDPLLEALSKGDVAWKAVKRIIRKKCIKPLYDLTTSCKNFIGNGVILHNCDAAHPSIYPTGEKPEKLIGPQQKLYDLIVRRFFSVFGKPALAESIRVELNVGGQPFFIRGRRILDEGWLTYYGPYGATEEILLPQMSEGQMLQVKEVKFEEKETQPPPRYNPASIVKKMEEVGIGTKATRAPILQNIFERGYVFGNQITVTDLGMGVVDALGKYCNEILSEELTSHFEREMEAIQEGKRSKEEVVREARTYLTAILEKFRRHQLEIGKGLGEALARTRLIQRTLGPCKCGGELRVIVSRKTRKRFAGCSNYPEKCRTTYPLPQAGFIIAMGKQCEQCGTPMIQVNRPGARPYRMCIDPKCPSKAEWGKRKGGGGA